MCTIADTTVTTIIMTAVSVSILSAQDSSSAPESIQVNNSVVRAFPSNATSLKITHAKIADNSRPAQVTHCAA